MGFHGVEDEPKIKDKRVATKVAGLYSYRATVQALMSLSALKGDISVDQVMDMVTGAPDPETAKRALKACFVSSYEALENKWHQTVVSLWSHTHPRVPLLPNLPLTAEDVAPAPILRDARCFLQELFVRPAGVTLERGQFFLNCDEALRLALVLPSWPGVPLMAVEHEHALPVVYRLRCLLQAVGLIRIYQGKLRVVQSRYQSFLRLPPVQQYYVLWHTEAYHVGWGKFAGMWGGYLEMIQGYLPLLWDLYSEVEAGELEDAHAWSQTTIEMFSPIWEEENNQPSAGILNLYQQAALPAIVEKLLLQDVLVRYGLLQPQSVGHHGLANHYVWTHLGQILLFAEHHNDLPCGVDLLKEMTV